MSNSEMKSGKYEGTITDVDLRDSKTNKEMVVLTWKLDNGAVIKSYNVIKNNQDGSRYEKSIWHLRRVFPSWDGTDANWFLENAVDIIGLQAELTVVMEDWNGVPMPSVKYIGRLKAPTQPPPTAPAAGVATGPEEDAKIEGPCTMQDVWQQFCRAHGDLAKSKLDAAWFALEDRIVGRGKDQLAFTKQDWSRISAAIKKEEKEFLA